MPHRSALSGPLVTALLAWLLVAGAAAAAAPAAAAERWRWPVRGEVVTPFVLGADPFAAGAHRGIDIAARAGEAVVAACSGRVRFAGRLPGRGRGVTVACGRLFATHLELGALRVRRGARVVAGAPVGTAAASHVQLGARQAGVRHGYVDPLALLAPDRPPPLGPVPVPSRPPRAVPPAAVPVVARGASVPAAPVPAVPLGAWLGLGALAASLPMGALRRRRRRRRSTVAVAAS